MKIYTKTGDDGTTGLQNGVRISKSNLRIRAYGSIDEINSFLGLVLSNELDDDIKEVILKIQNDLFIAGADLSNPDLSNTKNRITQEQVEYLEKKIDILETQLKPISNFILPGGHFLASEIHVARTVTRRAETVIVELDKIEKINIQCKKYLNRLSDLLFVMSRTINKRKGIDDIVWKP